LTGCDNVKKKLLALTLALLLVFGVSLPAMAVDNTVAILGDKAITLEELNSSRNLSNKTLTLTQDVTLELIVPDQARVYMGLQLTRSTLDLNGFTLTLVLPEDANPMMVTGISCVDSDIINGNIVYESSVKLSKPSYTYIVLAMQPPVSLENVELVTAEDTEVTAAVNMLLGQSKPVSLSNCMIDVGDAMAVGTMDVSGTPSETGELRLESGSYKNLTTNNNVVVNGTKLTTLPADVDDNTTVIVSAATTAMIVKDGNAYLYDTLQDAVNAVDAGGTIQLLKQPSDGKVTVPEDAGFRIIPFGEDSGVDTGKLQLVTEDGKKVTVGESGKVEVEQPWIVTLDNGNGAVETHEVTKGQPFTFPAAPSNSGYIFLGWRGADGRTYKTGDMVEISGDTTFKAVWGNLPDVTEPSEPETPDTPVFPFYDVTVRDWYYNAVKYVYEKGLMDGVDVGVFAPDDTLTRAMVWTIIARAEGVDTTGGATWYAKAQEWVTAKGISDGENPNAAITRQELVTMLYRLAGEPAVSGTITAPDAASVSTWAADAMTWAMSTGLVEGDENGAVTPTATATRAQAAAIFMRFIENIK
jgi:hypothetical protein